MLRPHWEGWLWRFSNTGTKWSKNLTPNKWDFKSKLNETKIICEEQTAGNQFSESAFRLKVSMIQILMFSQPLKSWGTKVSMSASIIHFLLPQTSAENSFIMTSEVLPITDIREQWLGWEHLVWHKDSRFNCFRKSLERRRGNDLLRNSTEAAPALIQGVSVSTNVNKYWWTFKITVKFGLLNDQMFTENTLQMLHQRNQ